MLSMWRREPGSESQSKHLCRNGNSIDCNEAVEMLRQAQHDVLINPIS